jgi:hypothetical protein
MLRVQNFKRDNIVDKKHLISDSVLDKSVGFSNKLLLDSYFLSLGSHTNSQLHNVYLHLHHSEKVKKAKPHRSQILHWSSFDIVRNIHVPIFSATWKGWWWMNQNSCKYKLYILILTYSLLYSSVLLSYL